MFGLGPEAVSELEQSIASAIAPAFLLTGIFSMLNVLAGRLARLIDRSRAIREGVSGALDGERDRLAARARHIHRAFFCCVAAAITLCALIIWSFVGTFLGLPVAWVLAALLIIALLLMTFALLWFLAEIRLGSRHLPLEDDA